VNVHHLKTMLWLRWRITVRLLKRSGQLNAAITFVFLAVIVFASVAMFFVALVAGYFTLPHASPDHILYLWDGIVVGFLLFWMFGLLIELQRSDVLSLDKLLHLPVSPSGAFLINYLSSFFSLSFVVFLPAMIGLAIAQVVVMGPAMLVVFPLLAGFLLMVTALTYQLRGWLATLMVNKRRRRTIISLVTIGMIAVFQLPNLINLNYMRKRTDRAQVQSREYQTELESLNRALTDGEIDVQEHSRRIDAAAKRLSRQQSASWTGGLTQAGQLANIANIVLPPGWLAYGAKSAAQDIIWPGLLGCLGSFAIAAGSLWRSYRTTLRFYRGGLQTGQAKKRTSATPTAERKPAETLLAKTLPWISEYAAATALANFRSLSRAPEVKMLLAAPIIMFVVFGSVLGTTGKSIPFEELRPLIACSALMMVMFMLSRLFQNQFGFDRGGFRSYVLSPAPRADILLGRNLSMAPFAMSFGLLALIILQFLQPLQPSHFAASLLQMVSMFLIVCMYGNQVSVFIPFAMGQAGMRAAKPNTLTMLLAALLAMLLPMALAPVFIPLGIDALLRYLNWAGAVPVYLILSAGELALLVFVYSRVLAYQGRLLQRREQKILEKVTAVIE
jgi:hypothetical protein